MKEIQVKLKTEEEKLNYYQNLWEQNIELEKQLSQLQQDKEELIKYCERLKKELKKYPEENPVEILDKEEKKWLNHFIKSTNIKVNYITKYDALFYNDREFLNIYYNINDDIESTILPYFKKGSMYQGMELDKKYTLEELGLE